MKNKIIAFGVAVAMSCTFIAVAGNKLSANKRATNVSTAVAVQHYNAADGMKTAGRDEAADMNGEIINTPDTTAPSTNSSSGSGGGIGDLSGLLGGGSDGGLLGGGLGDFGSFGEIFGDGAEVIGSLFGNGVTSGLGNNQNSVPQTQNSGYNPNYIDPVPAATYVQPQTPAVNTATPTYATEASTDSTLPTEMQAGINTTYNPYQKPKEVINPGDSGEGVKWVQWVLMFTNYGLQNKTVNGIYDDETVEVVKKFQKEQGLTDDGIINEATADKLEILYYQHSMTLTTVAPSNSTTAPQTTGEVTDGEEKGVSMAAIIAVIAAIWCIAIGVIVAVLIIKKKKSKSEDDNGSQSSATGSSGGDMNLSDLFEEANKE